MKKEVQIDVRAEASQVADGRGAVRGAGRYGGPAAPLIPKSDVQQIHTQGTGAIQLIPRSARITAIAVILADAVTKTIARIALPLCEARQCRELNVVGPLHLVRVRNAGSAHGFLPGLWLWALVAAAGVCLVPILGPRCWRPAGSRTSSTGCSRARSPTSSTRGSRSSSTSRTLRSSSAPFG